MRFANVMKPFLKARSEEVLRIEHEKGVARCNAMHDKLRRRVDDLRAEARRSLERAERENRGKPPSTFRQQLGAQWDEQLRTELSKLECPIGSYFYKLLLDDLNRIGQARIASGAGPDWYELAVRKKLGFDEVVDSSEQSGSAGIRKLFGGDSMGALAPG
jgi:hypothetical protein